MPALEVPALSDGSPSTTDITFRLHQGREAFTQLTDLWAQVLDRLERPDFFQRYEWYDAMLAAWPEVAANTCFLVAYTSAEPIGICPLQLTVTRLHGLAVRTLAPPDPNDVAYPGFVCAAADTAIVFGALLPYLRSQTQLRWDVLLLPRIMAEDSTLAALLTQAGTYSHPRGVCYYYSSDGGKNAIDARMSSGLRKHLRWCRRQLSKLGDVEFVCARDPNVLLTLLDEFLALEASGWKGPADEATAIKLDSALLEFYRGLLTRFSATGECEINFLRANGRNLAGQFCLLSAGTWYHLKIAYDEAFDKISPGSVLLDEVLTRLCADPAVQTASFLTGASWAERWHAEQIGVHRVIASNHTVTGQIFMQEVRLRRLLRERVLPAAMDWRRRLLRRAR